MKEQIRKLRNSDFMFALFYVSMSTLIETKMDNSWIDYSRMSLEYEKGVVKL